MEVVHRAGPAAAGGPTTMPEEEVAVQAPAQKVHSSTTEEE